MTATPDPRRVSRRRHPPDRRAARSAPASGPRRSSGPPSRSSPASSLGGVLLHLVGRRATTRQHGRRDARGRRASPSSSSATARSLGVDDRDAGGRRPRPPARQLLRDGDLDALVTSTDPLDRRRAHGAARRRWRPCSRSLAQQEALSSAVTDLGGDPGEVGRADRVGGARRHRAGARAGARRRADRRRVRRRDPAVHLAHDRRAAGRAGRRRGEVEPRGRAAAGDRPAVAAHGRQGARHRRHRADADRARRRCGRGHGGRARARRRQLDVNLGVDRALGGHLVRRRLHDVRAGARRARGAGVPAGGRRLGDRAGHDADDDPVHHRRQHRAVGPDQPARRRACRSSRSARR